jgi:Catalase
MAKADGNSHKTTAGREAEQTVSGGELHQKANSLETQLTTNKGLPISDDQNSLKAGVRGATLLEDFHLREKLPILTTSGFSKEACMRAGPTYTDFMRADLEAMTEVSSDRKSSGVARFARWNIEVQSGVKHVLTFSSKALPASTPVEIENQEIMQQ